MNCQIKFTLLNPVDEKSEDETLDREGLSENDKNTTENLLYDLNSLSGLNEDIDLNFMQIKSTIYRKQVCFVSFARKIKKKSFENIR